MKRAAGFALLLLSLPFATIGCAARPVRAEATVPVALSTVPQSAIAVAHFTRLGML